MPRQTITQEVNTFVGGLITEASPLTFPENSSIDESNFLLNRDGSRSRRLGFDVESGFNEIQTSLNSSEISISTFSWENVGSDPAKSLTVVQMGRELRFFDPTKQPVSQNEVGQSTITDPRLKDGSGRFGFSSVGGKLVVTYGAPTFRVFEFEDGVLSWEEQSIKTRDLFGVEDIDPSSGLDLTEGSGLNYRPVGWDGSVWTGPGPSPGIQAPTNAHLYNLRNQTWGRQRSCQTPGEGIYLTDPISSFFGNRHLQSGALNPAVGTYPSNADSVSRGLEVHPAGGDMFRPNILVEDPTASTPVAKGEFIIDVLSRGSSRISEIKRMEVDNPNLSYPIAGLNEDRTDGGARVSGEFAGRAWFGGFDGKIIDGDAKSPDLGSYVFFSQLVSGISSIHKCYQAASPTDANDSELVATDGGFIKIDSCYGVQDLINIGAALIVVAANGVWAISGGDTEGFTATSYTVTKVTDHGCISPNSVVQIDSSVMYWGDDGIYQLGSDKVEGVTAVNVTQSTIQTLYNAIPATIKSASYGAFDSYDRKARWLYTDVSDDTAQSRELIYDVNLQAWYKSDIHGGPVVPRVIGSFEVPPYSVEYVQEDVESSEVLVTARGDQVVHTVETSIDAVREIMYLCVWNRDAGASFTFGTYRDPDFKDWGSIGIGIDAEAYVITGYTGGDFQRRKQVPYLTVHMLRTEDVFEISEGQLVPTNQSSCLVQALWNWTNSANSGRWGREFQAYRRTRAHMPDAIGDPYDDGQLVLSTKNKLRGHGKVLSLKMRSEPERDLQLLGWSMLMDVSTNV